MVLSVLFVAGIASAADSPRPPISCSSWRTISVGPTWVVRGRSSTNPPHRPDGGEGLRFTHAHSCGPNCQPTRAALMTGQFGPRTGVYTVGGTDRFDWSKRPLRTVRKRDQTSARSSYGGQVLKDAGYGTAMFGKGHWEKTASITPVGADSTKRSCRWGSFSGLPLNEGRRTGGSVSGGLSDGQSGGLHRATPRKALLPVLPHFGVHSPFEAKPELVARFRDKPVTGGHRDPVYAAMIASVDESVGRVLDTLDRHGLTHNTLVIFSSDNGGVGGYVREGLKQAGDVTDNAPLRSGRVRSTRGACACRGFVRWPGVVLGVSAMPRLSVSIAANAGRVCGGEGSGVEPLDGGEPGGCWKSGGKTVPVRDLFWHFPVTSGRGRTRGEPTPRGAVRSGDWKLLESFEDGAVETVQPARRPSQTGNLAKTDPDKALELTRRLAAWRESVKRPHARPQQAGVDNAGVAKPEVGKPGTEPKRPKAKKRKQPSE